MRRQTVAAPKSTVAKSAAPLIFLSPLAYCPVAVYLAATQAGAAPRPRAGSDRRVLRSGRRSPSVVEDHTTTHVHEGDDFEIPGHLVRSAIASCEGSIIAAVAGSLWMIISTEGMFSSSIPSDSICELTLLQCPMVLARKDYDTKKSEINSTRGDSISEMFRLVFDDSKKMPTEISTSNICFSLDHPKAAGALHTQGKCGVCCQGEGARH